MNNSVIVPSAQRLAEDNNVDWRLLEGSGEGGSVVEQDVLSYLARVMQGDEATNPTPEPLPEGMSAWPEEAQRRRNDAAVPAPAPKDLFTQSFNAPTPTPAAASPWTMPSTGVRTAVEPGFASGLAAPKNAAPPPPDTVGVPFTVPIAMTAATPEPVSAPEPAGVMVPTGATILEPEPVAVTGVAEAVHQATLAELETLKSRLATLEGERLRHVSELRELAQLQATVASQKSELAKLGSLQNEVQELKAHLGTAQRAGEQAEALATQNKELELRLERARIFRDEAKGEFDRLNALNAELESKLATPKKRPWWRF